ncbi:MAG: hypothetical protein IT445_13320 [Phycisphaeraceae bacterium]|nr:hypothetical protein [Phycisphaeraceae bacterium]
MSGNIDAPYVVALSNHPQLFLDDQCIGSTINLSRRIQQPAKYSGNPVVTCDYPWEAHLVTRPSVIHEPELNQFRMHYKTINAHTREEFYATCYAESDDGLVWRKPLARHHLYCGQPSNLTVGPCHAIRTSHDPRRPYIGVTSNGLASDAVSERALYVFCSSDGLDWGTPHRITDTKCDTVPSIVWHEPAKRYFVYTRSQAYHPSLHGHMRITGVLESQDFESWTPKRAISLIDEAHGFPYVQAHALTAHAYGDILVGQVPVFHLDERDNNFLSPCEIQLATSRDGWHWRRVADGAAFLPHGPEHWERWFVHSCSMTRKNDLLYFYFHGHSLKHGALRQLTEQGVEFNVTKPLGAIGVATLPADRFLALEPSDQAHPGILDTPPIRFEGRELVVNAQAHPTDLQVELIDEQGPVAPYGAKPLPGFERSHSRLIPQDALRYRVIWTSDGVQHTLGDASPRQPFIVRFLIMRGQLFAFQIL